MSKNDYSPLQKFSHTQKYNSVHTKRRIFEIALVLQNNRLVFPQKSVTSDQ